MFARIRQWPVACTLILLYAIIVVVVATLFYTSHDPERQWVWIYAILAGYPSSLMVGFLPDWGDGAYTAAILLAGTLQWGAAGALIDTIVHCFKRKTALPYI